MTDIILSRDTELCFKFDNLEYYNDKSRMNKKDYYSVGTYTIKIGQFKTDGLHIYILSFSLYDVEIIEK